MKRTDDSRASEVRRAYETVASFYDTRTWATYWHRTELPIVARLVRGLKRRWRRVLDIGCGTGMYLQEFRDSCDSYVGLDISSQMLVQAKTTRRLRLNDFLCAGSGLRLPFASGTFDFVLASKVISHYPDAARFLAEMVRVADHNGFVLICDVHEQHGTKYGVFKPDGGDTVARVENFLRTPEDDRRNLTSLGCRVIATREIALRNSTWLPPRDGPLGHLWEHPDRPILYVVLAETPRRRAVTA